MKSFYYNMTRPYDKEYKFVARIDPNMKTGGFGIDDFAFIQG